MRIGRALISGEPRVVVDTARGAFALDGPTDTITVINEWVTWRPRLEALDLDAGTALDLDKVVWLPPVVPDKLVCVGTNYHDHVAEMERASGAPAAPNPWPFGFLKPPTTTLVGSRAVVSLPGYAKKVDWEAELAVIIGDASKATSAEPLDAVFGYTALNDLSVRDHLPPPHALGLDAIAAKGFDGAAPMGPWIVPAEEVGDPQDLSIRLTLNGELKQDSSTSRMIFGVREIVAHFGQILTLAPGDVIATGTPAGVGAARRPPESLSSGDLVEVAIDGICELQTTIG